VVAGRAHRAERSLGSSRHREIDSIEERADTCACRIPGAFARHRVGIERAPSSPRNLANLIDVSAHVHERDLVLARVPGLDVLQRREQLGVLSQRLRNGANPPDVLGVAPPRVVTPAVRV
jgi:hypothetical protein